MYNVNRVLQTGASLVMSRLLHTPGQVCLTGQHSAFQSQPLPLRLPVTLVSLPIR